MFQRKGVLEVGIEHAMREDDIRRVARQGTPRRETAVLPETVYDHAVEAVAVLLEPGNQLCVEAVGCAGGSERVHGEVKLFEKGLFGIVERDDLAKVADL